MRMLLFFTGSLIFTAGFAANPPKTEPNPGLDSLLVNFEKAVMAKDRVRLMELMDITYKLEQHDKFHKGNTERFLNELFCGSRIDQEGFKCIPLKKIRSIQLASKGDGDNHINVVFRVGDKKTKIDVLLTVVVTEINGEKVYGIYGAVG